MEPSHWGNIAPDDTTPALIYLIGCLQKKGVHIRYPDTTDIPQRSQAVCIPFLVSAGDVPRGQRFPCIGKDRMWAELQNHFRELQWRGATPSNFYSPVRWRAGAGDEGYDIPLSEDEILRKREVILNRSLDRLGVLREQLLAQTPVDGLCCCNNDLELANDVNDWNPWAVFIDDRPRETTRVEVVTLTKDAPPFSQTDPEPLGKAIENALRENDWKSRFGWVPCHLTDTDVFHLHDLLAKRVSQVSIRHVEPDGNVRNFIPEDYKRAISTLRSKLPTMVIDTAKVQRETYYVCRGDYIRVRRGLLRR